METVWITGASSGIGEACAYLWASGGARLVITAPTAEELAPVAAKCKEKGAPDVVILPYDLSNPDGIPELVKSAWEAFGSLGTTYLNAGISQRTSVEDTSMDMLRTLMEIDYFAPAAIAKELLPRMVAQGGGHIGVTTSIAGRFGFPLRCGYCSAKAALYGFFESLQAESYDKGIRVTIICPSRVRTNISLRALDKGGKPHGKMDPGQAGGIPVEKAAQIIVKAIRKGRREALVGGKELLMTYVKRFFPGLCARLSRKISPM